MFINRFLCSILEEQRELLSSLSIWNLPRYKRVMKHMIEECQHYGNKMEAALEDARDVKELQIDIKRLRKQIKRLETKKEKLKDE